MATEKKTRRVRKAERPKDERSSEPGYLERWAGTVNGIVELDVAAVHVKLRDSLNAPVKTGSALMAALDRIAGEYAEASRLAHRARLDYELYKEDLEEWLEPKRTVVRGQLEEMKKKGELKAQITIKMVEDGVRSTWAEEFRTRQEGLKRFQAAVHSVEALPDAFGVRARSLASLKDMMTKLGTSGGD